MFQLTPVKDKAVKIEVSVADGNEEGSSTIATTVANTDVTKPLIINTKFATSPGPGSESTDTASEVQKNSPRRSIIFYTSDHHYIYFVGMFSN